jgi:hypothetical protein
LASQQRMMGAGSVLITGRGKEDAFHDRQNKWDVS